MTSQGSSQFGSRTPETLRKQSSRRSLVEGAIRSVLFLCAALSVVTTAAIIYVLFTGAVYNPSRFWTTDSDISGTVQVDDQTDGANRVVNVQSANGETRSYEFPASQGLRVKSGDAVESGEPLTKYDTAFFQEVSPGEFLTGTEWYPLSNEPKFGVLPLIAGTLLVTFIAALIGLPLGLASAIYLSEYSSPRARALLKPTLELLAGIPTIVYGFLALKFVTPWLLKPLFQDLLGFSVDYFNAASAGVVVGIMITPMVSSLSEDVLRSVPRSLREAAYALGATKLEVSLKVVVPAALSGIIASFLLAVARAVGETMAVTVAAGNSPKLTMNPFVSVETMTAYIVHVTSGDTETGSLAEKSLYAVGMTLLLITLSMNVVSQWVLRRYREVYQ